MHPISTLIAREAVVAVRTQDFQDIGRGASAHEHGEGFLAKAIEEQTSKLPSDLFLWAAVGSIAGSLTLRMLGKSSQSLFVGQWAPTFLILGLYNKLVKIEGSE
jgi:hypothetical protein